MPAATEEHASARCAKRLRRTPQRVHRTPARHAARQAQARQARAMPEAGKAGKSGQSSGQAGRRQACRPPRDIRLYLGPASPSPANPKLCDTTVETSGLINPQLCDTTVARPASQAANACVIQSLNKDWSRMPRHEDHPVVIARLRAGVSCSALAREVGVDRSTIAAIEEGRTRSLSLDTALRIDRALKLRPGTISDEMGRWHADPRSSPRLTLEARAVLNMQAQNVGHLYANFKAWRLKIAPTPTAFASLLGVNAATVQRYENGIRQSGMPDTLASALMVKLDLTPQYVQALRVLPPSDE